MLQPCPPAIAGHARRGSRRASAWLALVAGAVLVLTLLALSPAGAGAAVWSARGEAEKLALSLPIARAAWPGSQCAGREQVVIGAPAEAVIMADPRRPNELPAAGMAIAANCQAWMLPGQSAQDFCDTLVHELGHFAGLHDVSKPGDIMDGLARAHWPACRGASMRYGVARIVAAVRRRLPHGVAWIVRCRYTGENERACIARRPGRAPRRFLGRIRGGGVSVHPASPSASVERAPIVEPVAAPVHPQPDPAAAPAVEPAVDQSGSGAAPADNSGPGSESSGSGSSPPAGDSGHAGSGSSNSGSGSNGSGSGSGSGSSGSGSSGSGSSGSGHGGS